MKPLRFCRYTVSLPRTVISCSFSPPGYTKSATLSSKVWSGFCGETG